MTVPQETSAPAAGDTRSAPATHNTTTSAVANTRPEGAPEVEVDVREDLRNGKEPFTRIMAAVEKLAPTEVLHLRATFQPVPLFKALGKRGFLHQDQEHAKDDWSVWFWKPEAAAESRTVMLDVRNMEPPEPLTLTLAALEKLPDDHMLIQINSRVPQFLIPMLGERGYACEIDDSQADRVLVRIWRAASNSQ